MFAATLQPLQDCLCIDARHVHHALSLPTLALQLPDTLGLLQHTPSFLFTCLVCYLASLLSLCRSSHTCKTSGRSQRLLVSSCCSHMLSPLPASPLTRSCCSAVVQCSTSVWCGSQQLLTKPRSGSCGGSDSEERQPLLTLQRQYSLGRLSAIGHATCLPSMLSAMGASGGLGSYCTDLLHIDAWCLT